ncbi:hypothetical protein LXL04_010744 [Taraxacum kok-saghyz]
MSTTIPFPPPPPQQLSSVTHYYITNLGLGYAIAIAFGFLVLFSSLLLASYICFRHRHTHRHQFRNPNGGGSDNGVFVPSIIFVDEEINEDLNVVVGLDQSVINSYPKFPFSKVIPKGIDSLCAICLCEYREAEMMRMLPDCKHCFHLTCVDAWLKLNASCPVCRSSPLPTPLSTPLAEVTSDQMKLILEEQQSSWFTHSLRSNSSIFVYTSQAFLHLLWLSNLALCEDLRSEAYTEGKFSD